MYSTDTIIYFIIYLLIVSIIIIPSQIKSRFPKESIKNYSIITLTVAVASLVVIVLIFIMHYFVKGLFSIPDGYSAADLTSSIVMAIATVIYVMFTYFILDATSKNTKQSAISIQQTANAQKIALFERRLELFYMPMQNALKKFNIYELKLGVYSDNGVEIYRISRSSFDFIEEYKKLIQYTYLASDTVNTRVNDFFKMLNSNPLLHEELKGVASSLDRPDEPDYVEDDDFDILIGEGWGEKFKETAPQIIQYYNLLESSISTDIESIKETLAKLVN